MDKSLRISYPIPFCRIVLEESTATCGAIVALLEPLQETWTTVKLFATSTTIASRDELNVGVEADRTASSFFEV